MRLRRSGEFLEIWAVFSKFVVLMLVVALFVFPLYVLDPAFNTGDPASRFFIGCFG
jgi:hypothetical protein